MKKDVIFEKYVKTFYDYPQNNDFMKKYNLNKNYGKGYTERFFIEEGVEFYKNKFFFNKNMKYEKDMVYNDSFILKNLIEIGCCVGGKVIIEAYRNEKLEKTYEMKKGEAFFFSFDNSYDSFIMKYTNVMFFTIMLDISTIANLSLRNKSKFSKYLYEKINKAAKKNYFLSWKIENDKIKSNIEYIKNTKPKNILDFLRFKTEIIKYMLNLIDDLEDSSIEDQILKKLKKIILKNISENIIIKDISARLKISDYLLQKKIKENYGMTLSQYIKRLKMEYAENLLKYTDMKIIDIASNVGYENPSKFSSVFSKVYGETPLKYRKSLSV